MQDTDELKAAFSRHLLPVFGVPSLWLAKGEGMKVWDLDGNEYLDFFAGIAVCGTGHCHPHVAAATARQVATLVHCSNLFGIPQEVALAERLTALSGLGKAFFSNSGAEANEAAVKIARKWSHAHGGGGGIGTAHDSFHGRTLVTGTATGQPKYQKGFEPLPNGFSYTPYNDPEALKAAVTKDTAALMLEPIQGESGVIPATKEYLQTARDVCDDTNTAFILDEVQTGMGRTGKMFAFEHFGVRPDILTLAKALGSGFPIGATLSSDDIASVMSPGDHGSTFGGNPLACTAALATLDVMEFERLVDNCARMGAYLDESLAPLRDTGCLSLVRGMGLLKGLVLPGENAVAFKGACQRAGLLVGSIGTSVIRLAPPLIARAEDVDLAVDIMAAVCTGRA
jgi:predicted acetylornithine/succinylornithine family transaminase